MVETVPYLVPKRGNKSHTHTHTVAENMFQIYIWLQLTNRIS